MLSPYAFLLCLAPVALAQQTPQLPAYTGPYGVGTFDVEVPVEPRNVTNTTLAAGGPAFLVPYLPI